MKFNPESCKITGISKYSPIINVITNNLCNLSTTYIYVWKNTSVINPKFQYDIHISLCSATCAISGTGGTNWQMFIDKIRLQLKILFDKP